MCDVPSIKIFFFFFFIVFIIEVNVSQMMALAGIELETLVSEPDTLTTRPHSCAFAIFLLFILFFYKRSICIIDNGASRRRTRNARFPAIRADHLQCRVERKTDKWSN